MSAPAITASSLRRAYGAGHSAFEAVRGVDLDVRTGELFALLGANGAGKTSTLEVLEGLAPATSGQVRVLGHDPFRQRDTVRPRTGIMLQEAGSPVAAHDVGPRHRAPPRRRHRHAHHALPRGGRGSGRPPRHHARRAHRPGGHSREDRRRGERAAADGDAVTRLDLSTLPALAEAPARERSTWTLTSTELQATLTALLTQAARHGVQLADLDARSATLEQAFLAVASDDGATAHHSARPAPAAA